MKIAAVHDTMLPVLWTERQMASTFEGKAQ